MPKSKVKSHRNLSPELNNYHSVNEALESNKYHLPTPDQILAKFASKILFNIIDLSMKQLRVLLDDLLKNGKVFTKKLSISSRRFSQLGVHTLQPKQSVVLATDASKDGMGLQQ